MMRGGGGGVRGVRAGLDVFSNEPAAASGDFTDPIVQQPGVYGTHHIGASTTRRGIDCGRDRAIIRTYKETGRVPTSEPRAANPATYRLIVRHRDRPGVLAHVFDHLREGKSRAGDREYCLRRRRSAVATINVDGAPMRRCSIGSRQR